MDEVLDALVKALRMEIDSGRSQEVALARPLSEFDIRCALVGMVERELAKMEKL